MAQDYFPEVALVSEVAIRQAIVHAYRSLGILASSAAVALPASWRTSSRCKAAAWS